MSFVLFRQISSFQRKKKKNESFDKKRKTSKAVINFLRLDRLKLALISHFNWIWLSQRQRLTNLTDLDTFFWGEGAFGNCLVLQLSSFKFLVSKLGFGKILGSRKKKTKVLFKIQKLVSLLVICYFYTEVGSGGSHIFETFL